MGPSAYGNRAHLPLFTIGRGYGDNQVQLSNRTVFHLSVSLEYSTGKRIRLTVFSQPPKAPLAALLLGESHPHPTSGPDADMPSDIHPQNSDTLRQTSSGNSRLGNELEGLGFSQSYPGDDAG